MKRSLISVLSILVLSIGSLSGCGAGRDSSANLNQMPSVQLSNVCCASIAQCSDVARRINLLSTKEVMFTAVSLSHVSCGRYSNKTQTRMTFSPRVKTRQEPTDLSTLSNFATRDACSDAARDLGLMSNEQVTISGECVAAGNWSLVSRMAFLK